jgi:hypothetical protein
MLELYLPECSGLRTWLAATVHAGIPWIDGEVSMRQLEGTSTQMRTPPEQPASKNAGAASEWDTETDVMPPETSRQLRRISRQLQQAE